MTDKFAFIGVPQNPYALLAHVAEAKGIKQVVVHIVYESGLDDVACAGVEVRDLTWAAARLNEIALAKAKTE